jgi:hypothetical protein
VHHPSSLFALDNTEGVVASHSFVDHTITYTPNHSHFGKLDEQVMIIMVEDGPDIEVTVQGQLNEVRCSLSQESIDLTDIPVFSKFETTFYVKNMCKTPSVIHVLNPPPGIEIRPMKTKLAPEEHKQFHLVLFYEKELVVDTKIQIQPRGGKLLSLPIKFSTRFPKVSILEENFDFGLLVA